MSSPRITTLVTVCLALMMCTTVAMAQTQHDDQHPGSVVPEQDTTVLPLIIPVMDDYAPPPSEDGGEGQGLAPGIGGSAYVDFSEYLKSGSLAPSYRFSPSLNARLRIPIIFDRTIEFFDGTSSTSGLGDVAIDMEYRKVFGRNRQEVRFTGTLKLPTGDAEKEVDGHTIALGTGSTDFIGRLHYTRSTRKSGFLAALLYRVNSAGDIGPPDTTYGSTTSITNGNLFVASGFGRYNVQDKLWLHFGASLAMIGNGEYENGSEVLTKATLLDLFPGVSYSFGLISPYLGVRIPVSTSWDDETVLHEDRATSFVLQFTYNPKSMTQD